MVISWYFMPGAAGELSLKKMHLEKDFWERKGDFLHQQKAYLCHVWRRTARFLYCLLHDTMNHWPWLTSGLWCCLHLAANLNWKWISLAVSILFGILWPARLSKSKLFKHCPRSNNTSLWLQIWTPTLFFSINLSISNKWPNFMVTCPNCWLENPIKRSVLRFMIERKDQWLGSNWFMVGVRNL